MSPEVLSGLILAGCAVIGGIVAAVRGFIRFAQYLVRSEEAQTRIAQSNQDIADDLARYMRSTDERFVRIEDVLGTHSQEIAVLRDRTRLRRAANGTT